MATVSPEFILRRTSTFLDEAFSQTDLRRSVLSSARRRLTSPDPTTLQALALLSQPTDSSFSASSSASTGTTSRPSPSALRTAEKLLLTLPSKNPLSSLLLAFVHALRQRHREAALSLLDLFALAPFAARYEVAAPVFEDLFIPHLLPAIQWFADQRSRILASQPSSGIDDDAGRSIEVTAAISLLSRMSGDQAEELKELERGYEDVLDENTMAYAGYLKEVLESRDGEWEALLPPQLILTKVKRNKGVFEGIQEEDEDDEDDDEGQGFGSRPKLSSRNGRYNPMWLEEERSDEFLSRQSSRVQDKNVKVSAKYSQRPSPQRITRQPSTDSSNGNANLFSDFRPGSSSSSENSVVSDAEFDPGILQEKKTRKASFGSDENQYQEQEQTSSETTCSSNHQMVDPDGILASGKPTPPKDFVCPITSNIFDDPVTLETGQTYERKAIQEWLDRGNSTCPITRQTLNITQLPKTNYVLKRLIASWREQNNAYSTPARSENPSPKDARDFNLLKRAPSPTSVISQASIDGATGDLRQAISRLCTSEILGESEKAVLQIERLWREAGTDPEILPVLSKPAVVNGFVEILLNSVNADILRSAVFMLTELASRDNFVIQTLTRVDSDVDCLVSLFKEGLVEAVVLIYVLSCPPESLIEMDMLDALVMAINRKEDESFAMCLKPRIASLFILNQMIRVENQKNVSEFMGALISRNIVEGVIPCLESDLLDEMLAAVEILLRCMEEDGNCREDIADTAEFGPLLESFSLANDAQRFQIVQFLNELVKLSRRTFNEQILHIIKDGGAYSTKHVLLVYLQTALHDQSLPVASLLLQLDILMEPRKMSIYREEAIDALISCLRNTDFPKSQLLAAETIMGFQGRYSSAGKSLAKAYLLKKAGMSKSYRAIMRTEQMGHALGNSEENLEEEKAAEEWERRIAFALVSHEFGLIFEALAEGIKSRRAELFSTCLVSATWLTHMLSILPDMGLRGAARVCLLKLFVSILKSARDVDDKALAMLALRSFMYDPDGLHDMASYVKEIIKSLRELKKSSSLAYEMLKLFSDGQESSAEMWNHKELVQVDCSTHGEVLSIVCFKNRIITGHSDGTIKVWSGVESLLNLIQEAHDHSKAVTSLTVSGERIYSGSTDKTMRVWILRNGEIRCSEIHDVKDQVHNLVVANSISCFIPQGAGVKVILLNGGSKLLNQSKNVKSLALTQGKLYCGCQDSSIQEIDLATGTVGTIQSGNRKLLGKSIPIQTMQVHDGFLYTASNSIEGPAVKVWNTSNYNLVGSLPTNSEVRSTIASSDLIYLGCKMGTVEIWSRQKLSKVSTLQTGTNGKVQCMAIDSDAELLVVGTSDGKIQAWGLT
ncbi:putative E3 ubiquitin-protein ligase LIN-1 [Dioscorea cayenensis subsp. rotundata]|uniref:RING-type E3 ubiquitin transferase n=1 Tax=Dioscorea cayennensis subsp. rotundata TaxID=55577 RepID=A0AB40CY45_DIOCR|nr:putative E3 ubiquitin-protein ligase LIN-1 [Dioscorea cayenensis subsp. rotundata]